MRSLVLISIVVCVISSISIVARADTGAETHASTHAPIAVMGDHVHEKGEVMISYRYMNMDMQGSRLGGDAISDNTIATTIPNRFFWNTGSTTHAKNSTYRNDYGNAHVRVDVRT